MDSTKSKQSGRPPLRIVLKYTLLQLPGQALFVLILLLARQWVPMPDHLIWGLIGVSVAKDILLFPFLWRHYGLSYFPDRFQMIGRRGLTLTRLNPDGYVRVRGERWQARTIETTVPIEKGQEVCVDAIDGLKLTVRICTDADS